MYLMKVLFIGNLLLASGISLSLEGSLPEIQKPASSIAPDGEAQDHKDEQVDVIDLWSSTPQYVPGEKDGVDLSDKIEIKEILEPKNEYRYAAFGQTDPFLPPYDYFLMSTRSVESLSGASQSNSAVTGLKGFEIPIISPLQTQGEFKVAGVWQLDDGAKRALILTPAGQGVIAKVGDPIGLSGKIIDISDAGVVFREYTIHADGSRTYEDKLLEFGPQKISKESKKVVIIPGQEPMLKDADPNETTNKQPIELMEEGN